MNEQLVPRSSEECSCTTHCRQALGSLVAGTCRGLKGSRTSKTCAHFVMAVSGLVCQIKHPSPEYCPWCEIERLDADAAGVQAELASVKACWVEALENVASRNREIERQRMALQKIACTHVAFPEDNYPGYASMALVTAREALGNKPPAPETRVFPQAPDTDERYNVSDSLLETLIEVAQDNGFRDVVEALRELQVRRGRPALKASAVHLHKTTCARITRGFAHRCDCGATNEASQT